jgi:hypothetical protein
MKTPKKKAPVKKKAPTKKASKKAPAFEAGMLTLNVSAIANTEQERGDAMHVLAQITAVAQTFGLHVSPTIWLPKSYLMGKPE